MFDPYATTIERSFGRSLIHPNAKNGVQKLWKFEGFYKNIQHFYH